MKKILLTMLALSATTISAFADAYDYGKISMIDGYERSGNSLLWIIFFIIIVVLSAIFDDKK